MLEQLTIRDFAVARSVTVHPAAGLNVFTGETGAGKSLIVDALAFVFGARRGRDVIAGGSERAVVEARVRVDGEQVVIERSIASSGRSSARLDGEPATIDDLVAIGARIIDIHGQSEQLAILRPPVQLAALDSFGGLDAQRQSLTALVRELRAVRAEMRGLASDGLQRERLLDQLRFEVEEIDSAGLAAGEDDALHAERSRLGNVSRLSADAAAALSALEASPLDESAASVAALVDRDPEAAAMAPIAESLQTAATDLRRALRDYGERLEEDPERLAAIDERLDRIARLRRKYGASVSDILEYGSGARARLEALSSSEERIEELSARESALLSGLSGAAEHLSRERRAAATSLVAALSRELADLGLGGASLAIGFSCSDDNAGVPSGLPDYEIAGSATEALQPGETHPRAFTETGIDHVEFLASFNAGDAARPLSAVASGGETSRFLLALASVLGAASEPRIVIFDEVDEGVGGRAGSVVGEALSRLAQRHQVLCITHLPQVAAYGNRHFVVTKTATESGAWSGIEVVEGEARIEELAAMLGSVTSATRATARELLAQT